MNKGLLVVGGVICLAAAIISVILIPVPLFTASMAAVATVLFLFSTM